jgi:hypothetical protein
VSRQFDDEEAEEEGDVGEVIDTDDDADEEELDAAGRTLQGTNADMQDGDDGGAHPDADLWLGDRGRELFANAQTHTKDTVFTYIHTHTHTGCSFTWQPVCPV